MNEKHDENVELQNTHQVAAVEEFGEWLGVTDWISPEDFTNRAVALLAEAHEEIRQIDRRYSASLAGLQLEPEPEPVSQELSEIDDAVETVNRRTRLRGLRGRMDAKQVSKTEAARIFLWILLKSGKHDKKTKTAKSVAAPAVIKALPKRLAQKIPERFPSRLLGDKVIREAIASGKYEDAYVWGRALFPKHSNNKVFVGLLEKAALKRGNISQLVALARHKRDKKWITEESLRVAEGRLNEITGGAPHLRPQPIPVDDRDPSLVLHFAKESVPYHSNGFCARSIENLKAERMAGYRPVVITEPGFPQAEFDSDVERELVEGIEHLRIMPGQDSLTKRLPVDEFNALYSSMALQKVVELKPSVIHASSGRRGYETALSALAVGEATGIPVVYEVRSSFTANWTGEMSRGETGEIFNRRVDTEMQCINRADHVIVICETLKAEIMSRGVAEEKITVVPNGVDVDQFRPAPKNLMLRDQLGLGESTVIGYVSNFDHPRESQELIVDAAKRLIDRGYDVKVLLVGKGNRLDSVRKHARKLGIDGAVVTPGSVKHAEIPDYYRLIDLFITPRSTERAARLITPLKPFEAMACGIPVVTSDVPALEEIVDSPQRGLSFHAEDADSLAETVARAIDSGSETRIRAKRAAHWVRENRLWSKNAARYRAVYEKLRGEQA